ncbi:hypothetical protein AMELA_G00193580, partial [Ameiurus melas]
MPFDGTVHILSMFTDCPDSRPFEFQVLKGNVFFFIRLCGNIHASIHPSMFYFALSFSGSRRNLEPISAQHGGQGRYHTKGAWNVFQGSQGTRRG